MTREGARFEFDCAHGSVDGAILVGEDGRFEARGSYARERPGPARPGDSRGETARFEGRIDGDAMTLAITLVDSGENVGAFSLRRGRLPRVVKCR